MTKVGGRGQGAGTGLLLIIKQYRESSEAIPSLTAAWRFENHPEVGNKRLETNKAKMSWFWKKKKSNCLNIDWSCSWEKLWANEIQDRVRTQRSSSQIQCRDTCL